MSFTPSLNLNPSFKYMLNILRFHKQIVQYEKGLISIQMLNTFVNGKNDAKLAFSPVLVMDGNI